MASRVSLISNTFPDKDLQGSAFRIKHLVGVFRGEEQAPTNKVDPNVFQAPKIGFPMRPIKAPPNLRRASTAQSQDAHFAVAGKGSRAPSDHHVSPSEAPRGLSPSKTSMETGSPAIAPTYHNVAPTSNASPTPSKRAGDRAAYERR